MEKVFYKEKLIGHVDSNNTKLNLTFYWEKLIYDLITELYPELLINKDIKIIDKQKIKSIFLKKYWNLNNLFMKIKPKNGTLYSKEKLNLYIYGWYEKEYTSKTMWARDIKVIWIKWNQLSNTHIKKAISMVLKGEAEFLDKETILLKKEVSTTIETIEPIRNILYNKQKNCCNFCKKEFDLELLDLHHKYIPQIIKTINYQWNSELVCKKCHKKRHENNYAIVNLLINIYKKLLVNKKYK